MNELELRVLVRYAQGAKAKEQAREMGIHYRTVEKYAKRARKKLGAKTTPHAIAVALRLGHISLNDLFPS